MSSTPSNPAQQAPAEPRKSVGEVVLSYIDYWGNALGEFFGVIGPKYQDEIDEAKRRGEEDKDADAWLQEVEQERVAVWNAKQPDAGTSKVPLVSLTARVNENERV